MPDTPSPTEMTPMPPCTYEHSLKHSAPVVIICPRCHWCSTNRGDADAGYCAQCRSFTALTPAEHAAALARLPEGFHRIMFDIFVRPHPTAVPLWPANIDHVLTEFATWLGDNTEEVAMRASQS